MIRNGLNVLTPRQELSSFQQKRRSSLNEFHPIWKSCRGSSSLPNIVLKTVCCSKIVRPERHHVRQGHDEVERPAEHSKSPWLSNHLIKDTTAYPVLSTRIMKSCCFYGVSINRADGYRRKLETLKTQNLEINRDCSNVSAGHSPEYLLAANRGLC